MGGIVSFRISIEKCDVNTAIGYLPRNVERGGNLCLTCVKVLAYSRKQFSSGSRLHALAVIQCVQ